MNTWRVTSPCGHRVGERRRFGVLVELALPPLGGDGTDGSPAVHDRKRASDVAGELLGDVAGLGQLVTPVAQLLHRGIDVGLNAPAEPDLAEHHQERHRRRSDSGSRHDDVAG